MVDLQGKKIILTGASQGLGAVAARAYVEQGATVALLGRQVDKINALQASFPKPGSHLSIEVDLLDNSKLISAINTACKQLDGVDVVFHAAGGGLGLKDPLLPIADIVKLFHLNVAVCAEINRLVIPHMRKSGGGNLVHVGSIASYEAVGSVGYNTAKAALAAYVRSLGRETASDNIIATGILPGGFHAPENAMDRLKNAKPEVYEKFVSERLPRKQMGDATELIPLIMLLSSPGASMMSGCLIPVDGGEGKSYQINNT